MSGLGTRVEARVASLRQDAAAQIAEALPGLRIEIEGDAVRIMGDGAERRWRAAGLGDLLRRAFR